MPKPQPIQQPAFLSTELANSITHGVGVLCSIAGLAVLLVMATRYGQAIHVVACSVYGATLITLYLASTLYHSIWSEPVRQILRIVDHAAIFLLIAGTYTPFTLVSLHGPWGWSLFGVIWGLAVLGIALKLIFRDRLHALSVVLYLAMGWLVTIAFKPLMNVLPMGGVAWLVAGGIAYTVGVVFYVWRALPHHHAIWHLFVMAGSACHFFAVMFYVIPKGT